MYVSVFLFLSLVYIHFRTFWVGFFFSFCVILLFQFLRTLLLPHSLCIVVLYILYTFYIESNSMRNVCERARSWIQSLNEMAYINRYGFPSTPSSLSAHLCLSLCVYVYFVVNFSFCLFSILCRYDMVVVAYLPNGRSFHAHTIVFALFVSPEKECVHIAVYFFVCLNRSLCRCFCWWVHVSIAVPFSKLNFFYLFLTFTVFVLKFFFSSVS